MHLLGKVQEKDVHFSIADEKGKEDNWHSVVWYSMVENAIGC